MQRMEILYMSFNRVLITLMTGDFMGFLDKIFKPK